MRDAKKSLLTLLEYGVDLYGIVGLNDVSIGHNIQEYNNKQMTTSNPIYLDGMTALIR
jgi:hypothetical protein